MGIDDSVGIAMRRWRIILLAVALGFLGAGIASMVFHPKYTSSSRVFVGHCTGGTLDEANQCGIFTKDRAIAYAELARTTPLAERVIEDLRLSTSAQGLSSQISASVEPNTAFIDLTVTDTNPSDAQAIARSTVQQFLAMVADIESPAAEAVPNPATALTVVESAQPASATLTSRRSFSLMVGTLAGLLLGVTAAIIRDRFDTTIYSDSQVADNGLPILGRVPRHPSSADSGEAHGRVEEFRRLRSTITHTGSGFGSVVLFAGPRSGVGTFAAALDIARAIAESGTSVVFVDTDMRTERPLPQSLRQQPGLADLLWSDTGSPTVANVLQPLEESGLQYLPPGLVATGPGALAGDPGALIAAGPLAAVLDQLRGMFAMLVVHAAPILEVADATVMGEYADSIVMVVGLGRSSEHELRAATDSLHGAGVQVRSLLFTEKPAHPIRLRRR